ncbi:hypothetical protein DM860_004596 [Cuscuta australis]|uniref:Uncharacterized protein n=1 Tax=Cuscuta australis TaxID=267555 RepID=A0A328E7V7_9ASTE|nr:hypothetical protein DM860_004596 [Cuscuta australis]
MKVNGEGNNNNNNEEQVLYGPSNRATLFARNETAVSQRCGVHSELQEGRDITRRWEMCFVRGANFNKKRNRIEIEKIKCSDDSEFVDGQIDINCIISCT